jgi:hypothetical protein
VLLEFSSARAPGPPVTERAWQRSYRPGGLLLAAGLVAYLLDTSLPDTSLGGLPGQVLTVAGACLVTSALVARRRTAADARREPRRWTIDDEELTAANRLGSVRWSWTQVGRVEEHADAYLLHRDGDPHTAAFDVPRDTLTAAQEAEFRGFLTARGLLPADL